MRFVRTNTGMINLAHVVRIVSRYSRDDGASFSFYDSNSLLGEASQDQFDPSDLRITFIPAAVGDFVWSVMIDQEQGKTDERPTQTYCRQLKVVGWKISDTDIAQPVLCDETCDNEVILIPMPDGRLIFSWVQDYDSIEQAREEILVGAQRDWDNKHQLPTAAVLQ